MSKLQALIIEAAQDNQRARDQEHLFPSPKRQRSQQPISDVELPITEFKDGDYVLVSYPDSGLGKRAPDKLLMPYKGPYQVVRHAGSRYTVRYCGDGKLRDVFVSQLRPFSYDPQTVNPKDIALKEMATLDIEKVLDHRGNLYGSRDQLSFKVRWANSTPDDDAWVPWKAVYRFPAAHAYFIQIKHKHMIPREFKDQAERTAIALAQAAAPADT